MLSSIFKELGIKVIVVLLIILGAFPFLTSEITKVIGASFSNGLVFLLLSGLISGLYYAYNDSKNRIWVVATNSTIEYPIQHYVHIYWVHILSGIFASALLLLLIECLQRDIKEFFVIDISLTTLVMLGYTGLLPRALWALANRGNPFKNA